MCHHNRDLWKLPCCLPSLRLETAPTDVQVLRSYPQLTSSACLAQPPWPNHPLTRPVSLPVLEGVAPTVSMQVKDQPESPPLTGECLLSLHLGDTR